MTWNIQIIKNHKYANFSLFFSNKRVKFYHFTYPANIIKIRRASFKDKIFNQTQLYNSCLWLVAWCQTVLWLVVVMQHHGPWLVRSCCCGVIRARVGWKTWRFWGLCTVGMVLDLPKATKLDGTQKELLFINVTFKTTTLQKCYFSINVNPLKKLPFKNAYLQKRFNSKTLFFIKAIFQKCYPFETIPFNY